MSDMVDIGRERLVAPAGAAEEEALPGEARCGPQEELLDPGLAADVQQVTEAFRILLSDPNVKAVLVNIFGGIAKCTTIAGALIEASKQVGFNVPLVVRLEGTNVEQGKAILADSGLAIVPADDLGDAARKIVAEVKGTVPA